MTEPVLYEGRPADETGRLPREIRTYDLLDRLGIPFQRTDHAPATTMEVCHDIDAVLDVLICKNLFLCNRQQTQFYLLLIPEDKTFKTKDISRQLGVARLSFGSAEKMDELLDVHPGSVSILALMNDADNRVQLLIDSEVTGRAFFGCHPCENTTSLRIKTSDLTQKIIPALHHTPIFVELPRYDDAT